MQSMTLTELRTKSHMSGHEINLTNHNFILLDNKKIEEKKYLKMEIKKNCLLRSKSHMSGHEINLTEHNFIVFFKKGKKYF